MHRQSRWLRRAPCQRVPRGSPQMQPRVLPGFLAITMLLQLLVSHRHPTAPPARQRLLAEAIGGGCAISHQAFFTHGVGTRTSSLQEGGGDGGRSSSMALLVSSSAPLGTLGDVRESLGRREPAQVLAARVTTVVCTTHVGVGLHPTGGRWRRRRRRRSGVVPAKLLLHPPW